MEKANVPHHLRPYNIIGNDGQVLETVYPKEYPSSGKPFETPDFTDAKADQLLQYRDGKLAFVNKKPGVTDEQAT